MWVVIETSDDLLVALVNSTGLTIYQICLNSITKLYTVYCEDKVSYLTINFPNKTFKCEH